MHRTLMPALQPDNNTQGRIAHACDRCHSKKLRCDGARPTCFRCAYDNFECHTRNKLSRGSGPRSHSKSLQERARQLELEVCELKALLNGKDEKTKKASAMRMNHHSSCASDTLSPLLLPNGTQPNNDSILNIYETPLLLGNESYDSYFVGASSDRALVSSFKKKLSQKGKLCYDFDPDSILPTCRRTVMVPAGARQASKVPPRLYSDRCVTIFFDEWAPLFPILHKPTFLRIYDEFITTSGITRCNNDVAWLYLVFSIADLSSDSPDYQQLASCEMQWTEALNSLQYENTMGALQCFVLALLYCAVSLDIGRLYYYKSLAVGLSHRMGLHRSQEPFSFGPLVRETRKKVFWTLYTLDCFTAAALGLPKLFREDDIHAEYPCDKDDEYITKTGFRTSPPEHCSRLSSALSLFRASRILSRTLENVYPGILHHETSLQQLDIFKAELDAWYASLPAHLRPDIKLDRLSTNDAKSRSLLIALSYYFIGTFIYRPVVESTLGLSNASALLTMVEFSKNILLVVQLLQQQNMSFSFCLNKYNLLIICGITLLYQAVDFELDSRAMLHTQSSLNMILDVLSNADIPEVIDLAWISRSVLSSDHEESLPPGYVRSGTGPSSRLGLTEIHIPESISTQRLLVTNVVETASEMSRSEWEALIGSMELGASTIYDVIYGNGSQYGARTYYRYQ